VSLRRTLDVLGATIERASSFPLSASCLVNRAEVLSLVERARAELPIELDEAAALILAHQDVIERAEQEAEQVLADARARADEMVEDSALVATARGRSDQILDAARTEAARLLREADQYCDHRLAVFEDDLNRAMAQVRRGRARLRERSDLDSDQTLHAHGAEVPEQGGSPEDGSYPDDSRYADGAQYEDEARYADGVQYEDDDTYAEAEPQYAEAEPQYTEAEPQYTEAEPRYAEAGIDRAVDLDPVEELDPADHPDPFADPAAAVGADPVDPHDPVDPAERRDRSPVGAGVGAGHRVLDVAALERAEAERAGLGHRANLQ
jgi:vacuolar-type H+-ATPase subunit H